VGVPHLQAVTEHVPTVMLVKAGLLGASVPANAHGAVHFTGTQLILELWRYADLRRPTSVRIRDGWAQR
jgi:hypothetical protein